MKENSIEEDIKIINNFITYFNKNIQQGNKADLTVLGEEIEALEHILSDYKKVVKENEELKILKSGIQTLQNLGIEDGKYIVMSKTDFLNGSCKHLLDDYISKQEIKDIINRIDYDIKKTKEIISNGRRNDYQTVRLRAMNTKSLDIKKRLQKLLESEE